MGGGGVQACPAALLLRGGSAAAERCVCAWPACQPPTRPCCSRARPTNRRLTNKEDQVDPSCTNAGCERFPNENAKVGGGGAAGGHCAAVWRALVLPRRPAPSCALA